jgi:hypothetical protein
MYRLADDAAPFGRLRLWIRRDDIKQLVEILAAGSQYLVHGIHPSTGGPYEWSRSPVDVGLAGLTPITHEQAIAFVEHLEPLLQARGYATEREVAGRASPVVAAPDQAALLAPDIERLREAVGLIPNADDRFPTRTDYVRMGYAIKAAAGQQHEDDAFEIFADWCSRWDGGVNPPDEVLDDWGRIHGPYSVGWNWIAEHARPFGFNDAADDFSPVVEGPTPPNPADAETEHDAAARWAAAATDHQRMAAILGNADRVFFLAMVGLRGDAVWRAWENLSDAATKRDPLTTLFRDKVLDAALKLSHLANEPTTFDIVLGARLERENAFRRLSADELRLLRHAAWVLVAPVNMLVGQTGASPGIPRRPGDTKSAPPEWLVEGWIPRRGVGGEIGPPGNGKSWILAELACRVALTGAGTPQHFAKRRVLHGGSVVCFATEDADGFFDRIERQLRGIGAANADIFVFTGAPPLSSPGDAIRYVRDSLQKLRDRGALGPAMIAIDTLKGATVCDENSAQDMGLVMATLVAIANMTDAFVMIAHHSAVADETRARGSGAIEGALDFEGIVGKKGDTITMWLKKNKLGKSGTEECSQWHVRDSVLRGGAAAPSTEDTGIGKACAMAAGGAIRNIATKTRGVTKTELFADLVASRPDLFVRDGKNDRSRLSRAKSVACDAGWIDERKDKYFVGNVDVPTPEPSQALSEPPADLDAIAPLL